MHLLSRSELRRAMLAQLAGQQCGGLHVEAIVSAFVEQLIALRDSFEHDRRDFNRLALGAGVSPILAKPSLAQMSAEDTRTYRITL